MECSGGVPDDSPTKSCSSAEHIVGKSRKLLKMNSRLFTDNANFYPWGLAHQDPDYEKKVQETTNDLLKRSLALDISMFVFSTNTYLADEFRGEGQAFLIDTGNGLVLATMKHNFCQEINKEGKLEECSRVVLAHPENRFIKFPFDQNLVNWDAEGLPASDVFEPTKWKYGSELEFIAVNHQQGSDGLLTEVAQERIKPFKAVYTTFEV